MGQENSSVAWLLAAAETHRVIHSAAEAGVAGGAIYDSLIAECALKGGADVRCTWNLGHFERFASQIAVRTPDEIARATR